GGLAVALAEMVTDDAGLDVSLPEGVDPTAALFHEQPGRALVQTTEPGAVEAAFEGVAPVVRLGTATDDGRLSIAAGETTIVTDADAIADWRAVIERELD
ncbi:AIR synthase-related protein, partial [Natronoarchaeum mannanilyticum]